MLLTISHTRKKISDYDKYLSKELKAKGRKEAIIKKQIRDARKKWLKIKLDVSGKEFNLLYGNFYKQIIRPINYPAIIMAGILISE